MSIRHVTEVRKKEELLSNKPKDIPEKEWLDELQSLFEEELADSQEYLRDHLRRGAQEQQDETLLQMEVMALGVARAFQADKHDLTFLEKYPLSPVDGRLVRLTEESPSSITAPGLPATYRASVPFERGRISGELVSLSAGQEAALRAVLLILEKYNYEGDQGSSPASSEWDGIYSGTLPKRSFSLSEYYEARGISSDQKGHYGGKAAEMAKQDLLDLAKSITVGPYQFDLAGGGTREIKSTGPLMAIWLLEVTDREKGGDWISHEERVTVDPRPGLLRYIAQVAITPSPLLLSGLGLDNKQENFVRIETDLHGRIKDYYQGKRYPQAVEHLATYLLTIDLKDFKIGKDKLARRIGLGSALDQGRRKRVSERITEGIELALHLGIITSYEEKESQYIFQLNPEKGRRGAKRGRQKALPLKKKPKKG